MLPVAAEEEFNAERGILEPSRSIKAGSKPETDRTARYLPGNACRVFERLDAYSRRTGQFGKTILDDNAVFILQRNNVGNGAQGNKVEVFTKIRPSGSVKAVLLSESVPKREQEIKGNPNSGEGFIGEGTAGLVWVDYDTTLRYNVSGGMVISDDEIDA
jgi:hypothetical protein